jgi:hypothetical protein
MKNLIELNENELHLINGGHDGTAYHVGEVVGSICREVCVGIISNLLGLKISKRR